MQYIWTDVYYMHTIYIYTHNRQSQRERYSALEPFREFAPLPLPFLFIFTSSNSTTFWLTKFSSGRKVGRVTFGVCSQVNLFDWKAWWLVGYCTTSFSYFFSWFYVRALHFAFLTAHLLPRGFSLHIPLNFFCLTLTFLTLTFS